MSDERVSNDERVRRLERELLRGARSLREWALDLVAENAEGWALEVLLGKCPLDGQGAAEMSARSNFYLDTKGIPVVTGWFKTDLRVEAYPSRAGLEREAALISAMPCGVGPAYVFVDADGNESDLPGRLLGGTVVPVPDVTVSVSPAQAFSEMVEDARADRARVAGPHWPHRLERRRIETTLRCSCLDDLSDPDRKRKCQKHGVSPWLVMTWPEGA